jgi:hypothetical protein
MPRANDIRLIPLRAQEFFLPVGIIEGTKGVCAERVTALVIEECLQEDAGKDPGESRIVGNKIPIPHAIRHHFVRDTLTPEEVIFARPCRSLDDPGKGDDNGKRKDRIPEMPSQVIPVKGGNIIAGNKKRLIPPQNPLGGQPPSQQGGKVNPGIDGTLTALATLSRASLKGDL